MGQARILYKILVGKYEGTNPSRRPKIRGVDNTKIDLKKGHVNLDWIHGAQKRVQYWDLVNMEINLRVPLRIRNSLTS
jgi:hypothetical protein